MKMSRNIVQDEKNLILNMIWNGEFSELKSEQCEKNPPHQKYINSTK